MDYTYAINTLNELRQMILIQVNAGENLRETEMLDIVESKLWESVDILKMAKAEGK